MSNPKSLSSPSTSLCGETLGWCLWFEENETDLLEKQLQEEFLQVGLPEKDVVAMPPAAAQQQPVDACFVAFLGGA